MYKVGEIIFQAGQKVQAGGYKVKSAIAAVALLLAACSGNNAKDDTPPPEAMEILYNKAYASLSEGKYKDAVKGFQEVERQHPYSEWATRAQVMAAYAAYRSADYDNAAAILERFVKLHPTSSSTAYAFYLTALCYYEQISDVGRDQKMTELALKSLDEVVKRFPDTDYARDAKLKLDLTYDHLAGKEMQVGRYYLKRSEYLAAINRFKLVVDKYQTTSHTAEALHRLVECYLALGITEEAQKYAAVLGNNFPSSRWYEDSYAIMNGKPTTEPDKRGFVEKMLDKL